MAAVNAEIRTVAQAFYNLQDCARGWNQEPERLKAKFRSDAEAAIATLNRYRDLEPSRNTTPDHPKAEGHAIARAKFLEMTPAGEQPQSSPHEAGAGECRPERGTATIGPDGDPAFQICAQASAAAARLTAHSRDQIRHNRALIAQSRALLSSQQCPLQAPMFPSSLLLDVP